MKFIKRVILHKTEYLDSIFEVHLNFAMSKLSVDPN